MRLPPRHVRLLRRLSRRWQRRLIFTGGALAVGIAAVGLARAADGAQHAFQQVLRHVPYGAFALTPLGFALIVWITNRYFPNTQGSGIPQAIATRSLKTDSITNHSGRANNSSTADTAYFIGPLFKRVVLAAAQVRVCS